MRYSVNSPVHILREDNENKTLCGWRVSDNWSRFTQGVLIPPALCQRCETIQASLDENQEELPRFAFALPFGFNRKSD